MEPTDLAIWTAGDGSQGAFGTLFDRHAKRVYNHCFRRSGSWDRAEDLTSATFLEAWRSSSRMHFVGDSALPWLLGVATNVGRNKGRAAAARYKKLISGLQPSSVYEDETERVDERLMAEAQMQEVLQRMQMLSDDEFDVVSLCVWGSLDYREAAEALSIPIGTLKSRLARARNRLETADISEHGDSGEHYKGKRRVALRLMEKS